jgi:hypothetical protein
MYARRGVSEIVSSLIVLLIVSIMGVSLYNYSYALSWEKTQYYIDEVEFDIRQSKEKFKIISVIKLPSNQLNVTYFNFGSIEISVSAAYIDEIQVTEYQEGLGINISSFHLGYIIFTSPIAIQSDQSIDVILVTKRGVSNEDSFVL